LNTERYIEKIVRKHNIIIIAKNVRFPDSVFSVQVAHPDRYIECYIAEQNLVGVGIGCATRDRNVVFCSTFAAFFSRAFDQIRMGAISQTNANFAGSHAGISIGKGTVLMFNF
jgi:transketolase